MDSAPDDVRAEKPHLTGATPGHPQTSHKQEIHAYR
jgi:hypothetical protein